MPNINWEYIIDTSNSVDGIKLCDLINSHFFTQVVREPTRITQTCQTTLDLVFYNYPDEITDVSVHEDFSSNHFVVNFSLFTKVTRLKKSRRSVYNLKSTMYKRNRKKMKTF